MTTKPPRVCDECRYDGGIHYTDDLIPKAYRCPNYVAAEIQAEAKKLSAEHSDARTEAIRRTIIDAAQRLPILSANTIQDELEAAQIEGGGAVGAAFTWAARHGYIEATGRVIRSVRPGTKGHHVFEYRSLTYRKAVAS